MISRISVEGGNEEGRRVEEEGDVEGRKVIMGESRRDGYWLALNLHEWFLHVVCFPLEGQTVKGGGLYFFCV